MMSRLENEFERSNLTVPIQYKVFNRSNPAPESHLTNINIALAQ